MPLNNLKKPIELPSNVTFTIDEMNVATLSGPKGNFSKKLPGEVAVKCEDSSLSFNVKDIKIKSLRAKLGLVKSLVNGAIVGVTTGFAKTLEIKGVGYKAALKGKELVLNLGFSHPINFKIPEGITIETPSQIEILVKGIDKCLVGQVAADIRAYRPVECYKGKGVRYKDEQVSRKEAKKK